ncbi:MAG: NarK family nitrate/nitrite MFS transporter [Bauldia sp.]|nr:NarK family nitrate/nitrite MFS transporter [Bauldia sp.]
MSDRVLRDWRPDDPGFWEQRGKAVARRNLWISVPNLLLSFSVWMVWSVIVAKLPLVGFDFDTNQLFWLAALPGLSGPVFRAVYSFVVPIFGGRLWTTLSTASLLIPAIGIGFAVQQPDAPYLVFAILALLCGFGAGNFASSMANISFFFPKASKGNALALNAGLGNLGVSVMQFAIPIVVGLSVFGAALGGDPQVYIEAGVEKQTWLQNAGFIWVPFLIISAAAAWFGMNDIADMKASFREQSVIFTRRHTWIMSWLYIGTFGSFIGYSAGFPLLMKSQFPEVNSLQFAFLGPLVGAISRAATGWISDRYGGGRVTLWTFLLMIPGVAGVLAFLAMGSFWGFFAMFMVLFFLSGVGNASTFQMIPAIMRKDMDRLMPQSSVPDRLKEAEKESAAIIGFTSAIGAVGAFFIPTAYGTSISLTGGASAALWVFMAFYASCAVLTWFVYTRRGGHLRDVERGKAQASVNQSTLRHAVRSETGAGKGT